MIVPDDSLTPRLEHRLDRWLPGVTCIDPYCIQRQGLCGQKQCAKDGCQPRPCGLGGHHSATSASSLVVMAGGRLEAL